MTLGQLVVFAGLLQQFATQITGMATIVNTLEQSVTAARRVFEVLDAPIEVLSPAPPAPLAACRGAVRFEDVSFGHGGALALDGVSSPVAGIKNSSVFSWGCVNNPPQDQRFLQALREHVPC